MPKKSDDSLDTLWLQAFVAVYEHGSFDAAAEALGCSQSTITNRVLKLEGWLGRSLFDREARPSGPTQFGWYFFKTAVDVLTVLGEVRSLGFTRHALRMSDRSTLHPDSTLQAAETDVPGSLSEADAPTDNRDPWWKKTFGASLDDLFNTNQ